MALMLSVTVTFIVYDVALVGVPPSKPVLLM